MHFFVEYHAHIAVLTARLLLGFLFFFQGYDAMFRVGVKNVVNAYSASFSAKGIPPWMTRAGSWYTAASELTGGLMLLLGLGHYIALLLLAINIVVASIAFGINRPMWDTKFVLPRLLLLLFLLMVPPSLHMLALDNLLWQY